MGKIADRFAKKKDPLYVVSKAIVSSASKFVEKYAGVHMILDIHPALNISDLINNLKTASARRARNRFEQHLKQFYWKPLFWHRAYFVCSVGCATLETVRAYVQNQGTEEHAQKKEKTLALAAPREWGGLGVLPMRSKHVQNLVY